MSTKTVADKLFIKEGYEVVVVNAPEGYLSRLRADAPHARFGDAPSAGADVIQVFVSSDAELRENIPRLQPLLGANGRLWVTYPKGTSQLRTDINRDTICAYADSVGLQPVSLIAVDETWSALRVKPI